MQERFPSHITELVGDYKTLVDAHNTYTHFQTYEDICTSIRELVDTHGNLSSDVIGRGADRTAEYPDGRPIEAIFATTPGTEKERPWALLIMEHENEMTVPLVLLTIAKVVGHHPELLDELGYNLIIIPAAHPDGIALQRWVQDRPEIIDLIHYFTGAARGAGVEQNAWAYPFNYRGLSFEHPTPEVQAIMALMLKYMPQALHMPHTSQVHESYDFTTSDDVELFAAITLIAHSYGFTMQTSAPEDSSMGLHDSAWPGIFQMHTIMKEIDERFPIGEDIPEGSVWRSGDNAYSWLSNTIQGLRCLVNEFSYADSPVVRDTSLSQTTKGEIAAEARTFTVELLQVVEDNLALLQPAIDVSPSPAVGRLIRSINWWQGITKEALANQNPLDDEAASQLLTHSECIGIERYRLSHMTFAGQVCSLALLLGNETVAAEMADEIKHRVLHLKEKYSIESSSLPQLVGAQALTHLVALRLN